ncbi:MAG: ABC transporter ATP-binding protein [Candidatus Bathyarchaeia archaeon]
MLQVNKLNSGYGKLQILYDISIECEKGEIVGIVGPNGSGKTTFLNSIFGLADVFSGSVNFDGEELRGMPSHKIAEKGIAYLMQIHNIFPSLTVRENLEVAAASNTADVEKDIMEMLEIFPAIKPFLHRKAGTLSGGERQMLALSMTLIRRPKLILLDEPTSGLSPLYATRIINKVEEINREFGVGMILVEQNVVKAIRILKKVHLLVGGKVVFNGTPEDLLKEKDLIKLYLGIKGG